MKWYFVYSDLDLKPIRININSFSSQICVSSLNCIWSWPKIVQGKKDEISETPETWQFSFFLFHLVSRHFNFSSYKIKQTNVFISCIFFLIKSKGLHLFKKWFASIFRINYSMEPASPTIELVLLTILLPLHSFSLYFFFRRLFVIAIAQLTMIISYSV